jgi:hypothetical protein
MDLMQKIMNLFKLERRWPWLAAGLGAFVAACVLLNNHRVINSDATLYARVASLFVAGEWKQRISNSLGDGGIPRLQAKKSFAKLIKALKVKSFVSGQLFFRCVFQCVLLF